MGGWMIAAPKNYHPLSYWLGRGLTAIVDLTLHARTCAFTLADRAFDLTLHARGLGLTLDERDNDLTLRGRTNALTLEVK